MENQHNTLESRVSLSATVIVAAGVAAAWIAAGSSGMMAHSLRHAVTCLALGIGVVAGWPQQIRVWQNWADFAGGIATACVLAVMPWEVVNILAAVIILCTFAHYREGVDRRAILLTAKAILGFAICHFLYSVNPQFWILGEYLGQTLGWIAGTMTGQPLSVGATFGGVDFLLLMIFLHGFWLHETASPRGKRALYGGLTILAAQFAYLVALAYSEKFISCLPAPVYPVEDDYMRLGAAIWQNSLRSMIPWNLPLVALLLQTLVAVLMFRLATWRIEPSAKKEPSQAAGQKSIKMNSFSRFGPAGAAILLAGLTTLWTTKPTLNDKTIVAYQSDAVRWTTPKFDEPEETGYGLLPDFVRSLGGKFVFSSKLTEEELKKADVVLLLEPDGKLSKDTLARLDNFATSGGSLLLAAKKSSTDESRKNLAAVFESWGIRAEHHLIASRTESWEQTCAAMNHPASIGLSDSRNGFGVDSIAALRVSGLAYPLVVGRWGWSDTSEKLPPGKRMAYRTGNRLGDLVLVAESPLPHNGKFVVLSDMTCLSDDRLPISYEFVGRLLGYLAQKTTAFPMWRTVFACASTAWLAGFIIIMRKPSQPITAAVAFTAAIVFCQVCTLANQRIVPAESENLPRSLALIDASHLEAYSDELWQPRPTVPEFSGEIWSDRGLGNFTRTLMRNGYLPLRLRNLSSVQIEHGSLLILMAPARSYSTFESETIREFVQEGGTLLCMAGAEESRAVNQLLQPFNLAVPHTPVSPKEEVREPMPVGSTSISYTKPESDKPSTVHFFAGWEIASLALGEEGEEVHPQIYRSEDNHDQWFIVSRYFGAKRGCVVVIADTFFAANANPDLVLNAGDDNERFWEWFLPWICGPVDQEEQQPKQPPNMPREEDPIRESGPDEG